MSAIEGSQHTEALEALRERLRAAQEALDNLRGEVDAIVVEGSGGLQIYPVVNTDQPYRTIVEEMQQGAVVLTPRGDIFYCNRGFEKIVQTRFERLIGRPLGKLVSVADEPTVDGLLAAGTGSVEAILRAADDTEVPVQITASRFGGSPGHVCLVVTDLTEQKRQAVREARLAQEEAARAEAEEANRAKDQFLNMLSHELRNPLGVILNGIEVLDQVSASEPEPARIREVIRRQAHHLGKLLDDLLDVARVGQGKIDLQRQPVDLVDVVFTAAEDHRSKIERAGISLAVSLPPAIVGVAGDRTRLVQTIGNLLDNARKWTPAGGQISVSLQQLEEVAELRVRDTGVGMSEKDIAVALEPFRQLATSPRTSLDGTGLGLPLTKALAEANRATFNIKSAVNAGTLIEVAFPGTPLAAE